MEGLEKVLQQLLGWTMKLALRVCYLPLLCRYVSLVMLKPPQSVASTVRGSALFHQLDSTWHMEPGMVPRTCWITFHVEFAFQSATYNALVALFFSEVRIWAGAGKEDAQKIETLHRTLQWSPVPLFKSETASHSSGRNAGDKAHDLCL